MVLHGPAVDSGIARNAGGVGDLGIPARGDFEKSREGPQIAGQCLGLDFLNEVGLGIRSKVIPGIVRGNRQGQGAVEQDPCRVDPEGELRRYQWKQGRRDGPAGQQVGAAPPQLARARTGEHEAEVVGLDEAVHLVEQPGRLLHFVDHRPGAGGQDRELPVQCGRVLAQPERLPGVEQIVGGGAGEAIPDPGGLAGPAWSEQKDGTGWRGQ